MAQPSSSHHERDRHRSERSSHSHRHHRTISSTTLLLILSLVLAVLAVMLSLPAGTIGGHHSMPHLNNPPPSANHPSDPSHIEQPLEKNDGGLLAYLSPKRTQALIARERDIALREAEVAKREAELLAGAPGGVIQAPPPPVACPICPPPATAIETVFAPAQTVIKEIVKEESLAPPGWNGARAEELFDRELKIAEREREITKREESVNRREHDASRREAWIMEQLISLGNDNPQRVDEEYHYEPVVEPPPPPKRKVKKVREPPIVVEAEYEEIKTVVQTETITVPAPASTRRAAHPVPEPVTSSMTTGIPRTTSIEYVREEVHDEYEDEEEEEEEIVVRKPRARRAPSPPNGWFGGW